MSSRPAVEQDSFEIDRDGGMTESHLEFFRSLLLEQRQTLVQAAQQTLEELRGEKTAFPDEADRASREEAFSLALRMRDRERRLLAKIDAALARIDAGTYGWCEETGEPIGLARLRARPTATLSIDGQERKEARERAFRG